MTDFVITEHDIELLNDPAMDKQKIWARVRSRPLSEELKKERKRVIKHFEDFIILTQHREGFNGSNCVYSDQFDNLIESLRSEP